MTNAPPFTLSAADQTRFTDLVRQASGIEVPAVRAPELEYAVSQSLAATGAAGVDALYQRLASPSGRADLDALAEALTIGETHFFRNRPQFEALTNHILPELIARRRATHQLRVWSAGCASGEEPYSLAILIERLLPDLDDWQVLILGTDLNNQSLAKAQRGFYSPWSFRELPPGVQDRYFIPRGREFEIVPRLRERVTFANLNLMTDSYPSLLNHTHALDLILFRNVLIYFRPETARRVVGRMHQALAEGGWLVVGHADNPPGAFEQLTLHNFPGTVAYQKDAGQEAARDASREKAQAAQASLTALWAASQSAAAAAARPAAVTVRAAPVTALAGPAPAAVPARRAADRYAEAVGLWQHGQLDEAVRRLTALAADQPGDARAPYVAARIYANRQQLPEAETLVNEALRRAPLHAPAHYLHGLILQETGRPEPALAALRRCIYADPQFVLGHYALASLLARTGEPERARKALENVTRWLAGRPREELLPEGDGLTAGRLVEMVELARRNW